MYNMKFNASDKVLPVITCDSFIQFFPGNSRNVLLYTEKYALEWELHVFYDLLYFYLHLFRCQN